MKLSTLQARLMPFAPLLACPKCGAEMAFSATSLRCAGGHCYDLSTRGYVNLAPAHDQHSEKYDDALFAARSRVFADGFYQPVADEVTDALRERFGDAPFSLADVGCGEGYYARQIAAKFPNARVLGVDLSRAAIIAAAKGENAVIAPAQANADGLAHAGKSGEVTTSVPAQAKEFARIDKAVGNDMNVSAQANADGLAHAGKAAENVAPSIGWLVADLKHLPIADGSLDCVLDVLTPADYAAFRRVLKPDGFFIKVVPGANYLREVRAAVAPYLRNDTYDNARVLEHLQRNATVLAHRTVQQTFPLTNEQSRAFLRMTPMTFSIPEETLETLTISSITVHLEVLLCR